MYFKLTLLLDHGTSNREGVWLWHSAERVLGVTEVGVPVETPKCIVGEEENEHPEVSDEYADGDNDWNHNSVGDEIVSY